MFAFGELVSLSEGASLPYLVFPSEVIEEEDQSTNVCALDFLHLWGLMSYPQNEEAQNRLMQGVLAANTKHVMEELEVRFGATHEITGNLELIRQLYNAPDARTVAEQSAADAAFGGTVAGVILGWTIFRAECPDTRASASLGNAFRMIDQACKGGRWRGGGAENLKRHIWSAFRPVAHLWAALHIWKDQGYKFSQLSEPNGLSTFLLMAEWFRNKGEGYTPTRAKLPILDAEETWKIRPEISHDWPKFDIRCDKLDAWDLRKRIKRK